MQNISIVTHSGQKKISFPHVISSISPSLIRNTSTCFLLPLLPPPRIRVRAWRACAAPVKTTRDSPARLSPVPRRRDAHTEATTAALERRVPGSRTPTDGPQRCQRGRLWRTLHVMGSGVRRVESRAAELRAQQPSWRRQLYFFFFFFAQFFYFLPLSALFRSHIFTLSSLDPLSVRRDDHGAAVHRRGCLSLREHAGRGFLLRWQVRRRDRRKRMRGRKSPLHLSHPLHVKGGCVCLCTCVRVPRCPPGVFCSDSLLIRHKADWSSNSPWSHPITLEKWG